MPKKPLPIFRSLAGLKTLYEELSAPRLPIITTLVRVVLKSGGSYIDRVTHTGSHARLEKKGHRNARRVIPLTYENQNGNRKPLEHVEFTEGSLYTPQAVSNMASPSIDYEWALLLKIDADLARQKTGDIMDGLVHYLDDLTVITNPAISARREKLKNKGAGGKRRKTNARDLLERYAMDEEGKRIPGEIANWITANRHKLNDDPTFTHEDYQDQTERRASDIDGFEAFTERKSFRRYKE